MTKSLLFYPSSTRKVAGVMYDFHRAESDIATFVIAFDCSLRVYSASYRHKVIPAIQPTTFIGNRIHPLTSLPFFETFEEATAACTAKLRELLN